MTAINLTLPLLQGQGWSLSASPFISSTNLPNSSPSPTLSEAASDVSLFSGGQNTQMYYASYAVLASRSLREDRHRIHGLYHRSINSHQR